MTKIEMGAAQPPKKLAKRGPGRPPKSKTQRIRELDAAGVAPKLIAEKAGVSLQQVYQTRYNMKKKELVSKPQPQKRWAEPKLLPMPTKNAAPAKPTFWQRVKAVFFPN